MRRQEVKKSAVKWMSTSQKKSRAFWPRLHARAPTSNPRPRENSSFSWIRVKLLNRLLMNCLKASGLLDRGTMMLMSMLRVFTLSLFTFSGTKRPEEDDLCLSSGCLVNPVSSWYTLSDTITQIKCRKESLHTRWAASHLSSPRPGSAGSARTPEGHDGLLKLLRPFLQSFLQLGYLLAQAVHFDAAASRCCWTAAQLHQFIQKGPYAVVLLRGARYWFVAHGADAAHLQPFYQTPVQERN
ncbi:hypothetical protein F7725_013019 [Dissostichus mawsoni]|uniref:Uncharacterized protein n=1 Tax=Dissostichus mawsoni TaxID=36200 RepID=A0A7J5YS47_DISMA|nr:hypothetical protein F7725_013019 [Dissostichus mawsoni]